MGENTRVARNRNAALAPVFGLVEYLVTPLRGVTYPLALCAKKSLRNLRRIETRSSIG